MSPSPCFCSSEAPGPPSPYSQQSWVVALDGGWEASGPHVTWGGLGDSMGEVLLQPSGVRQPAVSQ